MLLFFFFFWKRRIYSLPKKQINTKRPPRIQQIKNPSRQKNKNKHHLRDHKPTQMIPKLRIQPTSVNNGVGDSSAYITTSSIQTKTLVVSEHPGFINRFRERTFYDLRFAPLTLSLLNNPIQLLIPNTRRMWNL